MGLKGILKKKSKPEDEIDPLTDAELNSLLKTDYESPKLKDHFCLFLLLAGTGMRIGEALALQWGDIDLNGRFIPVRRSVVRGVISTPNSGKSRRVDMSLQLTEALKIHAAESKKKGEVDGLDSSIFLRSNAPQAHPVTSRKKKRQPNLANPLIFFGSRERI